MILLRIRRSVILDGVLSSVMGRYEEGVVGSLFGLSMVMIVPCFQMLGILQCAYEKLAMFVRAWMPCGPKCFRCKLLIPSGPVLVEFFAFLIVFRVSSGVNGVKVWSSG